MKRMHGYGTWKNEKKIVTKLLTFLLLVMSLEKKVLKKCYMTLIYLSGEYRLNESKVVENMQGKKLMYWFILKVLYT